MAQAAHAGRLLETVWRGRRRRGNLIALWGAGVAVLLIAGLLTGCTARIVSRPGDAETPARGIAYHLPATELTYVMTFRLTDCRGAMEITDAAIEQRVLPDRGAGTYLIDPTYLSTLTKSIPLAKVTVNNGMLVAIDYEARDRSADLLKEGAALVGDVVSAASPLQLSSLGGALSLLGASRSLQQTKMIRSFQPAGQKGPTAGDGICNDATRDALEEQRVLGQHLEVMKRNLLAAEVQLAEGRDGARERIAGTEAVIRKTQERLGEVAKRLTIQYRKPILVESGRCEGFGEIVLESAPFTRWFGNRADQEAFQGQFRAWIEENKLSYTISHCQGQAPEGELQAPWVEGLYYRLPAQCRLEITKDTLVATSGVEIMQCGRLAVLEITNGAFQDNAHRIEFDPLSGEIKSFEFRDRAVRASEALGGIAGAAKGALP